MRIAVLGGTGGTGKEVIRQALDRGYEVIALCRSPAKLNEFNHDRLQVIKCDIFDGDVLAKHFSGCEAVVSCLGITGVFFPWSNVDILQKSIKVIVLAMRQAEISRLIVMSSWCTTYKPDNPKLLEWFVKPLYLRAPLNDMAVMENYLQEQEGIDFTAVKPPQLLDGQPSDELIQSVEGEFTPNTGSKMRRGDVAKFILDSLVAKTWIRQCVAIGV